LARIMAEKGMNQVQLAKKSGIKQPLISHYINESKWAKYPSLKTLIVLGHALHCSLEDLVGTDTLNAPDKKLLTTSVNEIEITENGKKLIEGYKTLSQTDKEKIGELIEMYAERAAKKAKSHSKDESHSRKDVKGNKKT